MIVLGLDIVRPQIPPSSETLPVVTSAWAALTEV